MDFCLVDEGMMQGSGASCIRVHAQMHAYLDGVREQLCAAGNMMRICLQVSEIKKVLKRIKISGVFEVAFSAVLVSFIFAQL
jgi:hypothetical protein